MWLFKLKERVYLNVKFVINVIDMIGKKIFFIFVVNIILIIYFIIINKT